MTFMHMRSGKAALGAAALLFTTAGFGWAQAAPDADLVAKGKAIFEAGSGGIPCAACHGEDQTAIVGPVVAGSGSMTVHEALANVGAMNGLTLTEEQIAAVSAYLISTGTATATLVAPGAMGTPASTAPTFVQLATLGKDIFESGPDGLGCKECHGHDATVLVAPNLAGKTPAEVHAAIVGIEGMQGLVLSADDLKAVAAYLTQQAGK